MNELTSEQKEFIWQRLLDRLGPDHECSECGNQGVILHNTVYFIPALAEPVYGFDPVIRAVLVQCSYCGNIRFFAASAFELE